MPVRCSAFWFSICLLVGLADLGGSWYVHVLWGYITGIISSYLASKRAFQGWRRNCGSNVDIFFTFSLWHRNSLWCGFAVRLDCLKKIVSIGRLGWSSFYPCCGVQCDLWGGNTSCVDEEECIVLKKKEFGFWNDMYKLHVQFDLMSSHLVERLKKINWVSILSFFNRIVSQGLCLFMQKKNEFVRLLTPSVGLKKAVKC